MSTPTRTSQITTYKIATTAMLSAIAAMLMFLQIGIPIMPQHIQLDFSDLPALLASFGLGPEYGVLVCLIKNLFHMFQSRTFCIGELSNFVLGCSLVIPAGLIYRRKKTRKRALAGSIIGSLTAALVAIPLNIILITYLYSLVISVDVIIGWYSEILKLPSDSLLAYVSIFNFPFTLAKGLLTSLLTFIIYKPLSPLLHK